MEESDLKALLEEAITYKRPKDREHKSATFNVSDLHLNFNEYFVRCGKSTFLVSKIYNHSATARKKMLRLGPPPYRVAVT